MDEKVLNELIQRRYGMIFMDCLREVSNRWLPPRQTPEMWIVQDREEEWNVPSAERPVMRAIDFAAIAEDRWLRINPRDAFGRSFKKLRIHPAPGIIMSALF
jgi:hypothetical protein